LGRPASGEPEAELWLGAHPRCPSRVVDGSVRTPLDTWISSAPERQLGRETSERFGRRLPFLFKVLAAAEPLSLQVHPSLAGARAGFALEESRGVPRDAETRNYKDDNHKPELVCALSRFYALSGFRPAAESLEVLGRFGFAESNSPLFEAWRMLRSSPDPTGLRRFFGQLFGLPSAELRWAIDEAVQRADRMDAAQVRASSEMPIWLGRFAASYPEDPGVVLSLLLNPVVLEPGQALYLPAGHLHAYLGGLGLEIMASSDNVLRCGLTHKHIDVAELERVVDFTPSLPAPLSGETSIPTTGARLTRYPTSAPEFELSLVELDSGASWASRGPSILLALSGEVLLVGGDESLALECGQQAFCNAEHEFLLHAQGAGPTRLAVASLNPRG